MRTLDHLFVALDWFGTFLLSGLEVFDAQVFVFGDVPTGLIVFTQRLPFTILQNETSAILEMFDLPFVDRRARTAPGRVLFVIVTGVGGGDRTVLILDLLAHFDAVERPLLRIRWKLKFGTAVQPGR